MNGRIVDVGSALVIAMLLIAVPAIGAPETAPAAPGAAAAAEATADAATEISRLLAGRPLRLSTEDERPPDRFHFVLRLTMVTRGAKPQYTDYVVVKDGGRVGILVRSLDGLPYCYMTEGYMVMLDKKKPGHLLVLTRGAPDFAFREAKEKGAVDFRVSHAGTAEKARVELDLGYVLAVAAQRLESASFDRGNATLFARTKTTALLITLPAVDEPGGFGLRSFVTRNNSGQTLAFLDLTAGGRPPLDLANATPAAVKDLGLPSREMAEGEPAALALIVPPGFGTDARERAAAEKLAGLLRVGPPAGPTTGPKP